MRKIPHSAAVAVSLSILLAGAIYLSRARAYSSVFDGASDDCEGCDHPGSDCDLGAGKEQTAYRPTFRDGGLRKPAKDLFKE